MVTNVPDVFIDEVADHTMAMFLAAHRRLRLMHQLTVDNKWTEGRPYFTDIPRLYGQTIGLISFGNVAKAVARRCHAFGLRVIAYDPFLAELEMTAVGVEPVTSLIELCQRSDFLSMHAPLNAETRHMMGEREFRAMKKSAIFINNGRGPTVNEARAGRRAPPGLDRGRRARRLRGGAGGSEQRAAAHGQRAGQPAHRLRDGSHGAGNAPPAGPRARHRAAGQVAALRGQPRRAPQDLPDPLAALPDGPRPKPLTWGQVLNYDISARADGS